MNAEIWETLYQSLEKPQLDPVLTGFNANIDRVIPVTPRMLRSLEQHAVDGFGALLPRMKRSMQYCSADEVFLNEPSRYLALSGSFSRSGSLFLGGQAGIAAVHLKRLGIRSVTCAAPGAGPQTCDLLKNAGVIPLAFEPAAGERSDIVHLVFEYPPGLVPPADGVVARGNRFIVSPLHDPSTVIIPDASVPDFRKQVRACRRAFLSGYQYLRTDQEFLAAARQIRSIRSVHPLMRTHVECVSGGSRQVMARMLRHIIPHADSIGLNERELGLFMHALRAYGPASAAGMPSSPAGCVRDALAFAAATGIPRVHLHTFGYYILVLKSGTMDPEVSRNALLFAARVTADAAGPGQQVLSREGLLAYAAIRNVCSMEITTGIFRHNAHVVVIVPAYITQNVQKTTGLGDVLSATAFVADRF